MRKCLPVVLICLLVAGGSACAPATQPAVRSSATRAASVFDSSEAELDVRLVCTDSLGRTDLNETVRSTTSRCTPCLPRGTSMSPERSLAHARRLWVQLGRAPYDSSEFGPQCVAHAFGLALKGQPADDSLLVELALFELNDVRSSVRLRALKRIDERLAEEIGASRDSVASRLIAQFAAGVWSRTLRQIQRPYDLDGDRVEDEVHRVVEESSNFRYLRVPPPSSRQLGQSEAEWVSRLYTDAARRATRTSERARLVRLSLAPWVMLARWSSLDSAARALASVGEIDSVLYPARAVAAYHSMRQPIRESPRVMALFDSAITRLPQADSARFDSFDGVLAKSDDDWRYGFLPDVRRVLDARGWSIVDPLWSTRVNELQLERRARVAEADIRYADVATGQKSGSESRVGAMFVRLGAPFPRWEMSEYPIGGQRVLRAGWPAMQSVTKIAEHAQNWRVFYGDRFSYTNVTHLESPNGEYCKPSALDAQLSMFSCAMYGPSDWRNTPLFGQLGSIDVTVTRFRAPHDSADVLIGARIPLARFKSREDATASGSDRIVLSAWLANTVGVPIYHDSVVRQLPSYTVTAWTAQWSHRVGALNLMHRVEALEVSRPSGARGVASFISDSLVAFPLRGFGMSDVLIATSAKNGQGAAKRWSDLSIEPNGAAIIPNQRFAMVWETYNLTPGPDGRVHWRVRIRRESGMLVVRSDVAAAMSGDVSAGSRVLANENDAPDMSYERSDVAGPVVLDNITFGLNNAPPGRHVLTVTVEDLVSKKAVTRGVGVLVFLPASERRR